MPFSKLHIGREHPTLVKPLLEKQRVDTPCCMGECKARTPGLLQADVALVSLIATTSHAMLNRVSSLLFNEAAYDANHADLYVRRVRSLAGCARHHCPDRKG